MAAITILNYAYGVRLFKLPIKLAINVVLKIESLAISFQSNFA